MSNKEQIDRQSGPSFIEKVIVTANKKGLFGGKTVDLVKGIVNLKYYESLLQDNVVVDLTFADTGGAINNKTALAGLPIENECNVQLKFKDNNNVVLDFANKTNNAFRVEKVTSIGEDGSKSVVNMQLIPYEAIKNNKSGVEIRQDGKISEHVKRILTDKEYLNSKKKLHIDETANNLNYCFAKNKPFYVINRISKDAVPQGADGQSGSKLGKSAGFLFYETYKGYYFKGIDSLFAQKKKISIIYNNSPESKMPEQYDVKALTYTKEGTPSLTKKLRAGAWNMKNTQFNPFTLEYNVSSLSAEELQESLTLAAKRFPALSEEFNNQEINKNFSRSTFLVNVPGVIPTGTGLGENQQQLEKSKELNFDAKSIMNQSIMRYNQLVTQTITIVIPGDFSLHAGDVVFFDSNSLEQTKNKACSDEVDKESGGEYLIATLCHYLTPSDTYTKLVLVRDSVGRAGNATDGKSE
tara:strand:- start:44 stop:1444 length:1401 start_codon:yes stop_codon:yes gene_type:complete